MLMRIEWVKSAAPGVLVCLAVVFLANGLNAMWPFSMRGNLLSTTVLLGLVGGQFLPAFRSDGWWSGVQFARKYLLQFGIVLFGFRMAPAQLLHTGTSVIVSDLFMLISTFMLAYWLGTRVLGLDRALVILIGAGSAICGGSAVAATGAMLRSENEKSAIAMMTVTLFGTLGMLIYPWLFDWNRSVMWLVDAGRFGTFVGATMHDVGQVVAAGARMDADTAHAALVAKLGRVLMLAPFLMALGAWQRSQGQGKVNTPWFMGIFLLAVSTNGVGLVSPLEQHVLEVASTYSLATAGAALGLSTHVKCLRIAGWRPFVLAGLLFLYLVGGGLTVSVLFAHLHF